MRNLDFSSWYALWPTLFGLVLVSLLGVGIRLLAMQAVQQRHQRENRQINERLRSLIAAYKALGGSFTGDLAVNPVHLRHLRGHGETEAAVAATEPTTGTIASSDRSRRIRDAVEAALSDILLLGTDEQVQLAARAATELAEGRPVHTAELVLSLRDFVRRVLDLPPIPAGLAIPRQGPTRPSPTRGRAEGGNRDGADRGAPAKARAAWPRVAAASRWASMPSTATRIRITRREQATPRWRPHRGNRALRGSSLLSRDEYAGFPD